jgi:hypothetical protein
MTKNLMCAPAFSYCTFTAPCWNSTWNLTWSDQCLAPTGTCQVIKPIYYKVARLYLP